MDLIFEADSDFDFSKLSLGQPQPVQGGSFFTKTSIDNKDIFIQFPKCKTKQGIVQSERKYYSDLLYETAQNSVLSEWCENLESTFQKLIYEKRHVWFNNNIELNDIESAFTSSARLYKSGKQFLIRAYIPRSQITKTMNCNIYDESEKILSSGDVDTEKYIIPLIKIEGIRFSAKSFQIEYNIAQIMVLDEKEDEIINQCLIKRISKDVSSATPTSENFVLSLIDTEPAPTSSSSTLIHLESNTLEKTTNSNTIENVNIKIVDNDTSNKEILDDTSDEGISDEDTSDEINDKSLKSAHIKSEISNTKIDFNLETSTPNIQFKNSNAKKTNKDLEVVTIEIDDIKDTIKLKKPNEVYYELYKTAREKAKLAKKTAIEAYLEAKNIKTKYMLNDLDESDDEEIF